MSHANRVRPMDVGPASRFGVAFKLVCSGCPGDEFAPEERKRAERLVEFHNAFCGDARVVPVN